MEKQQKDDGNCMVTLQSNIKRQMGTRVTLKMKKIPIHPNWGEISRRMLRSPEWTPLHQLAELVERRAQQSSQNCMLLCICIHEYSETIEEQVLFQLKDWLH